MNTQSFTPKLNVVALLFAVSVVAGCGRADAEKVAAERGWGSGSGHFYVHHAPDPVNVQNGNFFLPVQDLYLPCYGFPLEVHRSYNSVAAEVGPFGLGWSFNYSVHISITPGETLTVIEPDGFINIYKPASSETVDAAEVDKIIAAKRAEDIKYQGQAKKDDVYDSLKTRLMSDVEFFRRQRALYITDNKKLKQTGGKFVSRSRGTTFIYRKLDGYERHTQDGRVEFYGSDGFLRGVRDRNGNELTFRFDNESRLSQVKDACGQSLKFGYDAQGRVVTVTDSLLRTLSYTYDAQQRMTSSRDLEGKIVRYFYDAKTSRMTKLAFPDKSETAIVYDNDNGKVVRQEGPGVKVTTYAYGKRGLNYEWAEVKDNEGGYMKYEYFPKESKTIYTDKANTKTVTVLSSCCSKPISITNEKGEGEFFKYNDEGNLIEKSTSGALVTAYSYEPRYNQVEKVTAPDGLVTRFQYDANGNLFLAQNSRKEEVKMRYNGRGKIISLSDHQGNLIVFDYNNVGKPTLIQKSVVKDRKEKQIGEIRIVYRPNGDIDGVTYKPDDAKTVQELRQTLADQLKLLSPAGISFDI